jgi:predicted nucleic acid-binding protein
LIAIDTNVVHALFSGEEGPVIERVRAAFEAGRVLLPPPVLAEAFSDPYVAPEKVERLRAVPLIPLHEGVWARAGFLRAAVKSQGYRAALADCLIAQCCIDSDIPLVTYDRDFTRFLRAGLQLA